MLQKENFEETVGVKFSGWFSVESLVGLQYFFIMSQKENLEGTGVNLSIVEVVFSSNLTIFSVDLSELNISALVSDSSSFKTFGSLLRKRLIAKWQPGQKGSLSLVQDEWNT